MITRQSLLSHTTLATLTLFPLLACQELAPVLSLQSSTTTAQFRGISAASESVVWASGRPGTYTRTLDGGATWMADTVPGASELFFIDVYAVDEHTAYLLGTHFDGGLGRIYKTTDGGENWVIQYSDSSPGVFLDGMAFWDADNGVAFGDPVGGSFFIVKTHDGGANWSRVSPENIPLPLPGEAGFAASGTAIATQGTANVWFGTGGGYVGRVYRSNDRGDTWSVAETPIAGNASSGVFGLFFWDAMNGVAVGGDHTKPNDSVENVARTTDGGLTWTLVGSSQPEGVRWGVSGYSTGGSPALLAVGPSGIGYSLDLGATWTVVDTLGFNTVNAYGQRFWVAGMEGRIGMLQLHIE